MEGLGINLRPTRPIVFDHNTNLITFGLDGRIYDYKKQAYTSEKSTNYAERFERSHPDQIFVHQNLLQGAVKSLIGQNMPLQMQDDGLNQLFGIFMPEMINKYGLDGNYQLDIQIKDDPKFRFELNNGITLRNLGIDLLISGRKRSIVSSSFEKAMRFSFYVDLEEIMVNVQNFFLSVDIKKPIVKDGMLTENYVGDVSRDNWNQFFANLLNLKIEGANVQFKKFDITTLNDQLVSIAGQFPNITANPSYQKEYMYAGLRFFNDK